MSEKKTRDLEDELLVCPECNGQIITDYDRGERHCEACGLVIDNNMVSYDPEFDENEVGRIKYGPPASETMHNKGMTTEIDRSMRDAHGRVLSSETRRNVYKFGRLQHKAGISNSQTRNLIYALTEISRHSSHIGLTEDVKKETAHLYHRAVAENIIRGRSITAVIAASFYLAGRICGQPRTLDEVAQAVGVSRKECGRIARFMKGHFNLRLRPPTGDDFLERFTQILKIMCKDCKGKGVIGPRCGNCKGSGKEESKHATLAIRTSLGHNSSEGDESIVCSHCDGVGIIGRMCLVCDGTGSLDLPFESVKRSRDLMGICEEAGLYSGKAPMGLVAAVIYTSVSEVAEGQITQRQVADTCSVTEVTLRNRCKDIQRLVDGDS